MTSDHLRSFIRAVPFQPFNVRMADDRVFHIHHPDFISIFPSNRAAIIHSRDDDTFSVVDLLLMTELEVVPPDQRLSAKPAWSDNVGRPSSSQ